MASLGILDSFYVYQFIRRLIKPFEKWEAFKTGVIDKDGNIITPYDKRTDNQKESFKYFDLLVLNLKKLLAKIPGGQTKFATYAAAVWLIREMKENNVDSLETLSESLTEYIKEEIANTANPANIAGLDNPPKFMGHRVFDVKQSTLYKVKNGKHPKKKYSKYLDEEDANYQNEIRNYCKSNPKESIIFRHNGEMMFLRRKG